MKTTKKLVSFLLMVCFVATSVLWVPETAFAKEIQTVSQAKKLAKKQVKGATVLKVEKDYEKGVHVYEIKLQKGKKEYELIYRASDSKLISYEWKVLSRYLKRGSGKVISESKCKKLALKKVSKGKITSLTKKRSKGIDIYKVKLQKGTKKYELKFHARTKELIDYEWELVSKIDNQKYIGEKQAKQIALEEAGEGTVVKIELDMDDGVPVYEVEVLGEKYKYEIKIHALTGSVLEVDREKKTTANWPSQEEDPQISLEEAKEKAAEDAGVSTEEVSFTKAKLDYEDGILVYDINFFTATHKYEYEIDAMTGEIRNKEKEKYQGDGASSDTKIDAEQAKAIAVEHAGFSVSQVHFKKVELEREDGQLIYEVEFDRNGMEYEYEIDAVTGEILKYDAEWDD